MKKLAKQSIELITLIGGCETIDEVTEILNSKGKEVEQLAYKSLNQ